MMMELLKLPNVRMGKNAGNIDESKLHAEPKALAWEVATKHPLWTIEVKGFRDYRVLCDTEELGTIGAEWYGSQTKLFVRNDRIGQNNTRKNAYHTDKVDKAYLRVKKTFGPMNLSERIGKAMKVAEGVLENQAYQNRSKARDYERPIENGLMKWARANMNQYVSWLTETHQKDMLDNLTKVEELSVDMVTIKETMDAFANNKTALVVLAEGKYIVKIRDNVQLYDDVTFPHELRGKLGMLKLVEKEQMVTGIGCRVNDEIFVLLLDTMLEDKDEK
jgi:hypothetical protein